jgi:hypothetical protein
VGVGQRIALNGRPSILVLYAEIVAAIGPLVEIISHRDDISNSPRK